MVGRENGDEDVTVKILYCGVCHSDLHSVKNEWGFTRYPIVPGYDALLPPFSNVNFKIHFVVIIIIIIWLC